MMGGRRREERQNGVDPPADASSGTRNIVFLGLVSFFADLSAEMVYPLIPLFLTGALGATPTIVGVVEGAAESVASLLRVFSGYVSDRWRHKKRLAFLGYSMGLVYKVALLLSTSWTGVLVARVLDRLGKGIRTAPRDVMVAESGDADHLGFAYGLRETLDMGGSAIGILAAWALVRSMGDTSDPSSFRFAFAVSALPVVIALCMFAFIRERAGTGRPRPREGFWRRASSLDRNLRLYLVVVGLFTLGNSSNAFLLLRAMDVGFSSADTILLYFAYNACCSVFSIPMGRLSDRVGRKGVLVGGYVTFALVYLGFAFPTTRQAMVATFVVYGIYQAVVLAAGRAFVAEIAPADLRGTMLGLESTLEGVALLPASVIAGVLWDGVGAWAPFAFGASLAFAAAAVLAFGMRGDAVASPR